MTYALARLPEFSQSCRSAVDDGGSYLSSCWLWSVVADKVLECSEHSADRSTSLPVPAIISRSLLHTIVTEHLLFRKLCSRWVSKQLTPEHTAKCIDNISSFSYTSRISCPVSVSVFRVGECVSQWFQFQAADFYDTVEQTLVPLYDIYLNSGGEFAEK